MKPILCHFSCPLNQSSFFFFYITNALHFFIFLSSIWQLLNYIHHFILVITNYLKNCRCMITQNWKIFIFLFDFFFIHLSILAEWFIWGTSNKLSSLAQFLLSELSTLEFFISNLLWLFSFLFLWLYHFLWPDDFDI